MSHMGLSLSFCLHQCLVTVQHGRVKEQKMAIKHCHGNIRNILLFLSILKQPFVLHQYNIVCLNTMERTAFHWQATQLKMSATKQTVPQLHIAQENTGYVLTFARSGVLANKICKMRLLAVPCLSVQNSKTDFRESKICQQISPTFKI